MQISYILNNPVYLAEILIIIILVFIFIATKPKDKSTINYGTEIIELDTTQLILITLLLFLSFSFFHEFGHYLIYAKYGGDPKLHFANFGYKNVKSYFISPLFFVTHEKELSCKDEKLAQLNGNFFSSIYLLGFGAFIFIYKLWRGNKIEGKFIRGERDYLEIVLVSMLVLFILILIVNLNPFSLSNDVANAMRNC